MSETTEISKSQWTRSQIMADPNIDYTKLVDIWSETNESKRCSAKPVQQDFYTARRDICKRWKVESVSDLPRKKNGSPNLSGMLRILMQNNPNLTNSKAMEVFASDGLKLNSNHFYSLQYSFRQKAANPSMEQSLEFLASHPTKSRARFIDPKRPEKRPRKKKQTVQDESAPKIDAEYMERQIEMLLEEARKLNADQLLLKDLLQARRRASAMALGY